MRKICFGAFSFTPGCVAMVLPTNVIVRDFEIVSKGGNLKSKHLIV